MTVINKKLSRRTFIAGSSAVSATTVLGGLFGFGSLASAATAATASAPFNAVKAAVASGRYPAFVYHCSLVHKAMSDKLTRIVADPSISAKDTNIALRSTRCPCCDTQINASYPAVHRENGKAYV